MNTAKTRKSINARIKIQTPKERADLQCAFEVFGMMRYVNSNRPPTILNPIYCIIVRGFCTLGIMPFDYNLYKSIPEITVKELVDILFMIRENSNES